MKKVLSLALVLCMAISCFAFAPTSAEIYWHNILSATDDTVAEVWDAAPWSTKQATNTTLAVWGYNGSNPATATAFSENNKSTTITVDKEVVLPGENRFGNAQSLKFDLSKTDIAMQSDGGVFLNIATANAVAGKTYTVFCAVKGSADYTGSIEAGFVKEANYGKNTIDSCTAAAVSVTDDWQLIKATVTIKEVEGGLANIRVKLYETTDVDDGFVYVDGIAMVEGDVNVDLSWYEENFKDPADVDGDKVYNWEDTDINGDGIPNEFDRDMDDDGVKNVWDRDMDNDNINNKVDSTPFGGVVGSDHDWDHVA